MNIKDHLKRIRKATIRHDLIIFAWISYSILLAVIILAGFLESVFYFSPSIRLTLLLTLVYLIIGFFVITIIFFTLTMSGIIPRYRLDNLAAHVGKIAFTHHNRVIIALKLETGSMPPDFSQGYDRSFITQTSEKLGTLDYLSLFSNRNIIRWKTIAVILLMFAGILILFNWDKSVKTILRWSHPREDFQAQIRSGITAKSGDIHLLGGSTATVEFTVQGDQPDSIYLRISPVVRTNPSSGKTASETLTSSSDQQGLFRFDLSNISNDMVYQAYYPVQHFWQAGVVVESPEYYILVSDPPAVEDLTITIKAPQHTGQLARHHDLGQPVIEALKGSQLFVRVASNLELLSAAIILNDVKSIELDVDGKSASGSFSLQDDSTLNILIMDQRGITNRGDKVYRLVAGNDLPPELQVIKPPTTMQVGPNMILPYHLKIRDDFGFSNLQLSYETARRRDSDNFTQAALLKIPGLDAAHPAQEIKSSWDLSALNLVPGDILKFHFELEDNDHISGPKITLSNTFIVEILSQPDLYAQWFQRQDNVFHDLQLVSKQLKSHEYDLMELLSTITETENSGPSRLNDAEKLLETVLLEIEKLSFILTALDSLYNLEFDLKLFSQDLRTRMNKLPEQMLVQHHYEISTPIEEDLNTLIKTLAENYASIDNQGIDNDDGILGSLHIIQQQIGIVSRRLDHALLIIPQLIAEQYLNRLSIESSRLIAVENILINKIKLINRSLSGPGSAVRSRLDLESLTENARNNLNDFTTFITQSIKSVNIFKDIHPATALRLESLKQSPLGKSIVNDLRKSIAEIRNDSPQNALNTNLSAVLSLQIMKDELDIIHNELKISNAQTAETATRTILSNVFTLHKQQESLLATSRSRLGDLQTTLADTPLLSRELAVRQRSIKEQLAGNQASLSLLANRSFSITPELWLTIHKTDSSMAVAATAFEKEDYVTAIEQQIKSMELLNTFFTDLYTSLRRMNEFKYDQTGAPIDNEMQNLITAQQKLLDQGMFLLEGNLHPEVHRYLLRKMEAEQRDLQRDLLSMSYIEGEKKLLDRTVQRYIQLDIQKIIEELENDRYDRRTYDLQQNIFNRFQEKLSAIMNSEKLDERSMNILQTDSDKAGSISFADTNQSGQILKKNRIEAALEASLSAGYPPEYEAMIRNYFTLLLEAESEAAVEPDNREKPLQNDAFDNLRIRH